MRIRTAGMACLYAAAAAALLSAVAGPRLWTRRQVRLIDERHVALRELGTVLAGYATEEGRYPAVASCDALRPFLEPKYIRHLTCEDPSGGALLYAYVVDGRKCTGLPIQDCVARGIAEPFRAVVISAGADRAIDPATAELLKRTRGGLPAFLQAVEELRRRSPRTGWESFIAGDLVFVDGEFMREYPNMMDMERAPANVRASFWVGGGIVAVLLFAGAEVLRRRQSGNGKAVSDR